MRSAFGEFLHEVEKNVAQQNMSTRLRELHDRHSDWSDQSLRWVTDWSGDFCSEILEKRSTDWTTDWLKLKYKRLHLVFVYGSLKHGQRNHDVLKDSLFLGDAHTAQENYEMYNTTNFYPVVFQAGKDDDKKRRNRIRGEVYAVTPTKMLELDQIEGNGYIFERKERMVVLTDQTYPTTTGKHHPIPQAWIYLGVRDELKNELTYQVPSLVEGDGKGYCRWRPQNYSSLSIDKLPF